MRADASIDIRLVRGNDPERMLEIFQGCGVPVERDAFARAELDARLALTRRLDSTDGATGTEAHLWREYFGTIFSACGAEGETAEAVGREVRRMHATDHLWTGVDEATPAALERLRRAGYRLGVVSNADGRVPALLEGLGLGHHFDVVIDSGRVGMEKPDPRIFELAVEALDLPAEACLYAGDLYPVDVVGARRAGLEAVLVDPWGAFADRDVERVRSVAEVPALLGL